MDSSPTTARYSDDDMLFLSGIQHFAFCPRQWALLEVEQQWADNLLTAEGTILHSRVDDPSTRATGPDGVITLRGVRVASPELGLAGIADAVELTPLPGAPRRKRELLKSRRFTAMPVEYKHGRSKTDDCDRLQLAAQAMALEPQLGVSIPRGAIFYWKTRRREYVDISPELRAKTAAAAAEMHRILASGHTPPPSPPNTKACASCSVRDLCMPDMPRRSVKSYNSDHLDEKAP